MSDVGGSYYDVRIRVEVTEGKATRTAIEDALNNELDQDVETDDGAVLNLMVMSAKFVKRAS